MKKLLLSFGLGLFASGAFGQVIFSVEAPAIIEGNYDFTYADNWGSIPDMTNPANSVLDTVMLAGADSLACTPLTTDLTGKVALLYRGTCEFGAKALAAENAGAIAVIIVNNIPGAAIPMGAGANGASVTIPVVMISQADGASIRTRLDAGDDVVVFIGNKSGYYMNDIGFQKTDVLRVNGTGIPALVAQTGADFQAQLGLMAFNYGQNDQTGLTVTAKVTLGAATINEETSAEFALTSGDSTWIDFANLNETSYAAGEYTLTYTFNYAVTDDYDADNQYVSKFVINDENIYALAKLDGDLKPVSGGGVRPADNNSTYSSCIVFRNDNASRLGIEGTWFNASTATGGTLEGLQVETKAYLWADEFTNIDDATMDDLQEIAAGEDFFFATNDQDIPTYIPFQEPVALEDDGRYLFCVRVFNTEVFLGYDNSTNYRRNTENDQQPLYPIESDDQYSLGGFTGGGVPAIAIKMFDADDLSINENVVEAAAYPNPAKDVITVKVNANGAAALKITDLAGRIVSTQDVTIANGEFTTNVNGLNPGTYVFSLSYANGTSSQFNVVVTK